MENLALTTLLLPFIGALVVSFSPQRRAAEWGVLFAALTTLCMLSLISAFYQADKVAVTLTLVNVGDVALFGLVIDRVSTLILFVVVFLGLLVTIYSTGYLTDKNREHPQSLLRIFTGVYRRDGGTGTLLDAARSVVVF